MEEVGAQNFRRALLGCQEREAGDFAVAVLLGCPGCSFVAAVAAASVVVGEEFARGA